MSCCCCSNQANNNQVIYWNPSVFSSTTINSDVLIPTSDSTNMPFGSQLPTLTLETDGSYIDIDIYAFATGDSTRLIKMQVGTPTETVVSIGGQLVDGNIDSTIRLTRLSSTQGRWSSISHFNSSQSQRKSNTNFTCNFNTDQPIKFYINQTLASSLFINHIRITKFIK